MALNFGFIGERLHPAHPVRVCPYRVVDTGEINRQLASSFLQEMGQEKAHFEEGQRILARPHHFIPGIGSRRHHGWSGNVFVPCTGRRASGSGDSAHQHRKKFERSRDLPSSQISRGGIAPNVSRDSRSCTPYFTRHLHDGGCIYSRLFGRKLRCELRINLLECLDKEFKRLRLTRKLVAEKLFPVYPPAYELAVV